MSNEVGSIQQQYVQMNPDSSVNNIHANSDQESFFQTLKTAVHKTDQAQKEASQAVRAFSAGESKNLHDVMIAQEKAGVYLRLMVQMRNKAVDAYKEIMRMRV